MEDRPGILIVGGYGVFGGRLARLLLARGGVRVLVAGRSLDAARAFCAQHGGEPVQLDRDGDPAAVFARERPFVVVDAAGPFQSYGSCDPYRLARGALLAGAHYLDLADDGAFVAGIVALDAQARDVQRVAISGASSVPAISSAAVSALAVGLQRIEKIETLILPGNRAPRGLSVMHAILAQVGRPLKLWRGDATSVVDGWSGLRRDGLQLPDGTRVSPRWSSWIGSPDLLLLPPHFRARSVTFRAGLELPLLHLGLWLLSWLPRLGLIRSLAPWSQALRWVAQRLEGFGSDRGGMRVEVLGREAQTGRGVRRTWTLIAESGEGPYVPAIPAFCLIERLLGGTLAAGARPCVAELSIDEIEQATSRLPIRCASEASEWQTLYERALGAEFARLPRQVQDGHDVFDIRRFCGEARVTGGIGPLAWLIGRLMRFPPTIQRTPVVVQMERRGASERWTRQFGRYRFESVLSAEAGDPPGQVRERFGPLAFRLKVPVDETGLQMPMLGATALGLPLPRWIVPVSRTREYVDAQERFCFDVDISLPVVGRVVRYEGWLVPEPAHGTC